MPDSAPRTFVALAFDYGLKRIGVAAGDTLTLGARPITTIAAQNGVPVWKQVEHCIRDWDPSVLVVGLPYNMDGTPTPLTDAAQAFGQDLATRFGRSVEYVDERLSSHEAEDQLRRRRASGERTRRVGRADIDAAAAAVLLEQWLREAFRIRN